MENINPQNWPTPNNQNNNGDNRPLPPPPPPPEITLRTMQSDIETMKKSGGESPVAQPFNPTASASAPQQKSTIELSALSKEDASQAVPAVVTEELEAPKKKGNIIKLALILVVLIGIGALGYFVVYPIVGPMLFPKTQAPIVVNNPPVVNPPITEQVPATEQPATTSPITEQLPVLPVIKPHQTLFTVEPDAKKNVELITVTLASIKSALTSESAIKLTATTGLKEMIVFGPNGQINFSETLPLFLTEFASTTLSQYFLEDFTTFLYYDKSGVWPGIVAKVKDSANVANAKTEIAKLETSAALSSFYLTAPGTADVAGFKDGATGARYLKYSATGASLNYNWVKTNVLVISTSYNGFKAALTKLGTQ
ncbi:MAG: hypothetical protein PHN74_02380 [Candidatus Pacebacteria bacterium]|nr:hypothetical protein [Candidatus Paceibacterota bacterium]